MRIVFYLLILTSLFNIKHYWEDISEEEKLNILGREDVDKDICKLFNNNSFTNFNHNILKTLVSSPSNKSIKALYFYVFNQICIKADGETSEILGNYCLVMILSDIDYTLSYIKKHPEILEAYSQKLGYEFAFKEEGLSNIKYSFEEFKAIISKSYFDELFLNLFYKNIYIYMQDAKD